MRRCDFPASFALPIDLNPSLSFSLLLVFYGSSTDCDECLRYDATRCAMFGVDVWSGCRGMGVDCRGWWHHSGLNDAKERVIERASRPVVLSMSISKTLEWCFRHGEARENRIKTSNVTFC